MKKNKFMRLASVMLMLCLITTCAISGTFAKYTTSAKAQDSARVAKWGLGITISNNSKIFAVSDVNDKPIGTTAAGAGIAVQAADGTTSVLAPGTDREITVTITGKPEVALRLSAEVNLNLGTNWTKEDSSVYCPLVFTVGAKTYKIGDTGITNTAELETAVEAAILDKIFDGETTTVDSLSGGAAEHYDFVPNSDGVAVSGFTIGWSWPFETTGNDVNDTFLGNKTDGNVPTVNFNLVINADQLD